MTVVIGGAQLLKPSSLSYTETDGVYDRHLSTCCLSTPPVPRTVWVQAQRRVDPAPGSGGASLLRGVEGETPDPLGSPSDVTMDLVGDACSHEIAYLWVEHAGVGPRPWVRPHDAVAELVGPSADTRHSRARVYEVVRSPSHGNDPLVVEFGFAADQSTRWRRAVAWRPFNEARDRSLAKLATVCSRRARTHPRSPNRPRDRGR